MKKILIILTGGTFGMHAELNEPLKPSKIETDLFKIIPEINTLADIHVESVFSIDSSNIQPAHWVQIAEKIEKEVFNYDGFVVIHGTDTMAYTASALSFMFSELPKAVIFTGSQTPISFIRNDARLNLINAVELATKDIPEVGICFGNKLYRGNRTSKVSIYNYEAFSSPNYNNLATIGLNIDLNEGIRKPDGMFSVKKNFDSSVMSFPLFPGIKASDFNILAESSMKAIIFEAFGAGNVPVIDNNFIPLIDLLVRKKKIVAIKSQCFNGAVDLNLYEGGRLALDAGAISCNDMTRESSITKLMFLLGQSDNLDIIKKYYQTNLAGELTNK